MYFIRVSYFITLTVLFISRTGKIKTTVSTPRSATANKIAKSPITSQAEATVNKHRAILARALSQAVSITSKSKRT